MSDEKIEKFFCRLCGQKTNHFVRAEHTKIEIQDNLPVDWRLRMLIVECCGCENLAMVKLDTYSAEDGNSFDLTTGEPLMEPVWGEAIYPPVNYRKPPEWFEDVPDAVLRNISSEIYKSLQMESRYLAAFGARTLIDRLILLTVGDQRNFQGGLNVLQNDGKISKHERDILQPVIEAGHAAAHRGWAPKDQEIKTILDTVEGLIRRLLVLPKLAEELEEAVPKRLRDKDRGGVRAESSNVPNTPASAKVHRPPLEQLKSAPENLRMLYEKLDKRLKALGDDVRVSPQKHYIAYRRGQNFACVLIRTQKNLLRAYLNIDPDETDLDGTNVLDARRTSHFGTGDLEVNIETPEDLDRFADLFAASYENS